MKWVARERLKIDRVACPWPVTRFIDKAPEFLFASPDRVLAVARDTGAIPYAITGVELSHAGPSCSFDAFLRKYNLTDPALVQLAHRPWRPLPASCLPRHDYVPLAHRHRVPRTGAAAAGPARHLPPHAARFRR